MEPHGLQGLQGVTYANSTFMSVGDSGTILTSPDGSSWTSRTSGTSNSLYGVTYGNSTFVAVGGYGYIRTSSDGTSWTIRTSGSYGNGTSRIFWGVTSRWRSFTIITPEILKQIFGASCWFPGLRSSKASRHFRNSTAYFPSAKCSFRYSDSQCFIYSSVPKTMMDYVLGKDITCDSRSHWKSQRILSEWRLEGNSNPDLPLAAEF